MNLSRKVRKYLYEGEGKGGEYRCLADLELRAKSTFEIVSKLLERDTDLILDTK